MNTLLILKWYSIILIGISILGGLINIINYDSKDKRKNSMMSLILNIPIFVYLILY